MTSKELVYEGAKGMSDLQFRHHEGCMREVRGCHLSQDKAGRFWLWWKGGQSNLAFKSATKEDCILEALDHLLFIVQLRDERIAALERIATLAEAFAAEINHDAAEG